MKGTMLYKLTLLTFCLSLSLKTWCGITSTQYERLSDFSDDELRMMGNKNIIDSNNPDSALFYYYFVINRLIDKPKLTEREYKNLIASYSNVGYVYMFYFYDYGKALDCLIKTQELVKDDYTVLLLNLGYITSFYAQCFPSEENIRLTNDYFTKSFFSAVNEEDWYFCYISFANLWIQGFDDVVFQMNEPVLNTFPNLPIRLEDPDYRVAASLYRAARHIQMKKYDEALNEFRIQLAIGSNTDTPERDFCQTLYMMNEVDRKSVG